MLPNRLECNNMRSLIRLARNSISLFSGLNRYAIALVSLSISFLCVVCSLLLCFCLGFYSLLFCRSQRGQQEPEAANYQRMQAAENEDAGQGVIFHDGQRSSSYSSHHNLLFRSADEDKPAAPAEKPWLVTIPAGFRIFLSVLSFHDD